MAEQDAPLTSLCALCHISPLKYTCPRCGIHTCSLACVKLHKTRAQCSGVRNPAEYRKRSELATGASFDKDFNFITSVERNLQRANEDVVDKKVDLRPANALNFKGGLGLERAAEARGVTLVRAPVGLSRRQENKSRVLGKEGNISWTVEWIERNDRKRIQNHDDTKTIAEAYYICHPKKGSGKKRKRGPGVPGPGSREDQGHASGQQTNPAQTKRPRHDSDTAGSNVKELAGRQEQLPSSSEGPEDRAEGGKAETTKVSQEHAVAGGESNGQAYARKEPTNISESIHFYLLRPQTSSKLKCLIPISATATIKDALRGKKIMEYPTIHVKDEAPQELSQPFILESRYLEQHGEDVMVPPQRPPHSDVAAAPNESRIEPIDTQKVLEVLKQDTIPV